MDTLELEPGEYEAAVERARPVLERYATLVVHTGPVGSGTRMKIARNLITFASFAAVGEAQRLAAVAGLDVGQLGDVVRHKVYGADYVDNVASSAEGLETSPVVESTRSGTVLIGASRERVGFDRTVDYAVLARLAEQARALFPVLGSARVQRTYRGFRPYCPDHLPVIGPDPRVDGVVHACGHEGAGIGLAPATGRLVAQALTGAATAMPLEPFSPLRFGEAA